MLQVFIMSGRKEDTYYHSNYWWINVRDNWLEITLIATLLMIMFALVLITHRICGKRSSYIYKPCSRPHSSLYTRVYRPTTCSLEGTRCDVNNQGDEHVIMATDASVIGDAKRGNCNIHRFPHTTKMSYCGFYLSNFRHVFQQNLTKDTVV